MPIRSVMLKDIKCLSKGKEWLELKPFKFRSKLEPIRDIQLLEVSNKAALLQPEEQVSSLHFIVLNKNTFRKDKRKNTFGDRRGSI